MHFIRVSPFLCPAAAEPRKAGPAALNVEAVVFFRAVHAELPAVHDAYPVGTCQLAALLADVRIEVLCRFGEGNARGTCAEHLLIGQLVIIFQGFLPAHFAGGTVQHQAHRLPARPLIESIGALSSQVEEQVPLACAAAQDHLDGVHPAGVVLGYADDLFVFREF